MNDIATLDANIQWAPWFTVDGQDVVTVWSLSCFRRETIASLSVPALCASILFLEYDFLESIHTAGSKQCRYQIGISRAILARQENLRCLFGEDRHGALHLSVIEAGI